MMNSPKSNIAKSKGRINSSFSSPSSVSYSSPSRYSSPLSSGSPERGGNRRRKSEGGIGTVGESHVSFISRDYDEEEEEKKRIFEETSRGWDHRIEMSKNWDSSEHLLSFIHQTHMTTSSSSPARLRKGHVQSGDQVMMEVVNFSLPPLPPLPPDIDPVRYKTSYSQARSMGGLQTLVRTMCDDVVEAQERTEAVYKVYEVIRRVADGYRRKFQKQHKVAKRIMDQREVEVQDVKERIVEGYEVLETTDEWIKTLNGLLVEKEEMKSNTNLEIKEIEKIQDQIERMADKIQNHQRMSNEISLAINAARDDLVSNPDLIMVLEEEKLDKKVTNFRSKAKMKWGLRKWRMNLMFVKSLKQFQANMKLSNKIHLKRNMFNKWSEYTINRNRIKEFRKRWDNRKLQEGFDHLLHSAISSQKIKYFQDRRLMISSHYYIQFWHQYARSKRLEKEEEEEKVRYVREMVTKRRLFSHWRWLFKKRSPTNLETISWNIKSTLHFKHKCFKAFCKGVSRSKRGISHSKMEVMNQRRDRLIKTTWLVWKNATLSTMYHKQTMIVKYMTLWNKRVEEGKREKVLNICGMRFALFNMMKRGFEGLRHHAQEIAFNKSVSGYFFYVLL